MMRLHASIAFTGAVALALLFTGCTGSEDPTTPEPSTTTSTTASEAPDSSTPSSTPGTDDDSPVSDGSGGAVDEVRDGTWQVGEAGEVEFAVQNGALSLTEVRPADGWQQRVADERADEIEVRFSQGDQEWKFEVESENGTLEISKELKIRGGTTGDFQVGSAATVTLTVDGGTISVGDLTLASGWSTVKQDESPDDVELSFRNDSTGGTAEFEAEIDGSGGGGSGVKIEISQKLRGPVS